MADETIIVTCDECYELTEARVLFMLLLSRAKTHPKELLDKYHDSEHRLFDKAKR